MFIVYKKNNQKRISWKRYNPQFTVEMILINMYLPEKTEEVKGLLFAVREAHKNKTSDRHILESNAIKTLELLSSWIEAKEGFRPIFFKEED